MRAGRTGRTPLRIPISTLQKSLFCVLVNDVDALGELGLVWGGRRGRDGRCGARFEVSQDMERGAKAKEEKAHPVNPFNAIHTNLLHRQYDIFR